MAFGKEPHRGVEISLNALVELLDDSFFERASYDFRSAAGLPTDAPAPEEPEELTRKDVFQHIGELLSSPRTDEGKRSRLVLLQRFVARARVESVARPARLLLEQARGGTFSSTGKSYRLDEAQRELPRLNSRDARVALERDLGAYLTQSEGDWARWVDQLSLASQDLGQPLTELVGLIHGRPVSARLDAAKKLLADTHDAALDLTGFALKRVDAQLTVKTASEHDLDRACLAPWLFESFRREDLEHAITRCLGDLGLNPSADGRITVDAETRAGRQHGAHVFELRVPDQVRLVLTVDLGFEAYSSWLNAWGLALHRAHVSRTLPFVERRLGDWAVVNAMARLFESFLLEEGWLKRYLRLGSAAAREAARMFAFRQLIQLRRQAALALALPTLWKEGPGRRFSDEAVELLQGAALVEVPRAKAPLELDVFGGQLLALDGAGLEAVVHDHLRERFNEDYFRNPAAGRWLLDFASRGQRDDATVAASSILGLEQPSSEALDLARAAHRRVERMSA